MVGALNRRSGTHEPRRHRGSSGVEFVVLVSLVALAMVPVITNFVDGVEDSVCTQINDRFNVQDLLGRDWLFTPEESRQLFGRVSEPCTGAAANGPDTPDGKGGGDGGQL